MDDAVTCPECGNKFLAREMYDPEHFVCMRCLWDFYVDLTVDSGVYFDPATRKWRSPADEDAT